MLTDSRPGKDQHQTVSFGGMDSKPGLITALAAPDAHLTLEEGGIFVLVPRIGKFCGFSQRLQFRVRAAAKQRRQGWSASRWQRDSTG